MSDRVVQPESLAIVGTGSFAVNLAALCGNSGLETALFVDEFKAGENLGKPVYAAAGLTPEIIGPIAKWVVAISDPSHRQAAVKRLRDQGVASELILPLVDDPTLQILRLLFEEFGLPAVQCFCAAGVVSVGQMEDRFLAAARKKNLAGLDRNRQTVGLGYFGRGGGFRRHISGLAPLLADRFNVVTMSDEVLGQAEEAARHLYLSTETACALDCLDLVLSAHVFPCAPPSVPRVSFSHVIYDLNLTAEYQAARIALSETHYLFASSRPAFDAYVDLVSRYGLQNRICIVPGGYLQLDRNLAAVADYDGPSESIIYAPTLSLADYPARWTHSELVTSVEQGPGILAALLAAFPERQIIFRPHPADLQFHGLDRGDPRSESFGQMLELCRTVPRCHLDDRSSYLDSYRQSALMISDSSSTAFTFAFTTGRPVVFFSPREAELVSALGEQLKFVADRRRVGDVVTSLDLLPASVERLLQKNDQGNGSRREFRDQMIFNVGSSASYFVENIDYMLNGEQHPDWRYFNW